MWQREGPNEVIPRILYWCRSTACMPLSCALLVARHAAQPRTLWRLRRVKSSRERTERGRERPKWRGRARTTMWRRRDDRSAVSVTATVVRCGCTARFSSVAFGILDLSFFPPISPSLYLASFCRSGLSNSPQGRRRWRRFFAHARAWRQDDCQKRTRTKRATLRFCERKHDRFRLGPRWDRPRFHEQARGRPSSHFVSRWVENHSHFRLLRKERCLNAARPCAAP